MYKNKLFSIFILVLGLFMATSCSKFRKIQKSDDWKVKYEAAFKYYESKDYHKAKLLFEEILPIIKGTKEAEKAQFYYAYSHYYQKLYTEAAYFFKSFYDTYSRSPYAEEAMFMQAYSSFKESPGSNLDQTSTYEAIATIQSFINKYPKSKYLEQSNDIIDELQRKLEAKAYENAKLYYKINKSAVNESTMYKAAIRSFDNFQKDFPDSPLNEEISFLKIEAQYQLAKQSFKNLQKERYAAVVDFYQTFIDSYPTSKFLKEAEGMYTNSLSQISELQSSTK